MADPLILTTLRSKQVEIERQIDSLNASLSQARADLFHVAACIRMFDPVAVTGEDVKAYAGAAKAMKRTEMFSLCKAALEAAGKPLDTRELASHVIDARGWNPDDRRLRITVAHRVTTMLARYHRLGKVRNEGLRDGVTLWPMPAP